MDISKNHVGEVFGDLTIIADIDVYKYKGKTLPIVRCRCSCGNEVTYRYTQLVNKYYSNCGCKSVSIRASICRHCEHCVANKAYTCNALHRRLKKSDSQKARCEHFVVGRTDQFDKTEHNSTECFACGKTIYYYRKYAGYDTPIYCPECAKTHGERDRELFLNMDARGLTMLVQAIFERAKEDYVQAELWERSGHKLSDQAKRHRDDAVYFFYTKWAKVLSMGADINPEVMFRYMDREIERRWRDVNREHTSGIDE